jgi:hypothetical protein
MERIVNKQEIIAMLRAQFQAQFDLLCRASQAAREEATSEENKAENQYDTRGLEASYLAAGQAERAEELAESLRIFKLVDFSDMPEGSPIAVGALVETDFEGELSYYLLAPSGGGMTCEYDGREITVLATTAPLFKKLVGLKAGAKVQQPNLTVKSVI